MVLFVNFLRILLLIRSYPGDLLLHSLAIFDFISCGVIGLAGSDIGSGLLRKV
jgi:hypothetical protein